MAGNTISETITGPTFGNSTSGTKVFKAVTSVFQIRLFQIAK